MDRLRRTITLALTTAMFAATVPCCAVSGACEAAVSSRPCSCCDRDCECPTSDDANGLPGPSVGESERSHSPEPIGCPLCRLSVHVWTDTASAVSLATQCLSLTTPWAPASTIHSETIARPVSTGRLRGVPDDGGRAASLLGRWRI